MAAPTTDRGDIALNDWGKLALLGGIVGCVTLLACLRIVTGEIAIGVYLYVGGYVTGNGVLARRKEAPSTLLAAKIPTPDEAT